MVLEHAQRWLGFSAGLAVAIAGCGSVPAEPAQRNQAVASVPATQSGGTTAQAAQGGTAGAAAPAQPSQPTPPIAPVSSVDAAMASAPSEPPKPPSPAAAGLPAGAEQIVGLDLMQRLAGKWTGTNKNTPLGFDFPMTVEFAPNGDGLLFGKLQLDAQNTVLWGFNIETYDGKDVLAYRNGGYLGGILRDSRTKLIEHDAARGYYRFCAVKESGVPVDGCNYIDARYTFSAPDKLLYEVFTRGSDPHVHWEATRQSVTSLPNPFPAAITSQGDGSAAWPEAAGIP